MAINVFCIGKPSHNWQRASNGQLDSQSGFTKDSIGCCRKQQMRQLALSCTWLDTGCLPLLVAVKEYNTVSIKVNLSSLPTKQANKNKKRKKEKNEK